MIRESILRCLDRLSLACHGVNALLDDLRREPINGEEMRWLFFGLGQLLPQFFEPETTMAAILVEVRSRLTNYRPDLAEIGTQALKEGMLSSARNPPNV